MVWCPSFTRFSVFLIKKKKFLMLVQSPNLSPAQRERRKHSNFLFLDICSTKKNYFLPKNSEVFQIIWSLQYLHAVFKKECYSFSVTFDTL